MIFKETHDKFADKPVEPARHDEGVHRIGEKNHVLILQSCACRGAVHKNTCDLTGNMIELNKILYVIL